MKMCYNYDASSGKGGPHTMHSLQIRTLGEFSLTADGNTICDLSTRSRKTWNLLAYLIQHRASTFSQQRLIDLFWGEDSGCSNPENSLRITLHRLRSQLDKLWPGAGRELILYRDGSYRWNDAYALSLDCEEFERLCQSCAETEEARLERLLSALAIYRGSYLPRQSSELWVVPLAAHLSNLFLQASMEAAQLLSRQDRHREAVTICRRAAACEPYHEGLHLLLIRELAAAGDPKAATDTYNKLHQRLSEEFGIAPGEELRSVYRSIAGAPEDRMLPMEEVLAHIHEHASQKGAMVCDYDHFKLLCYAKSRSLEQTMGTAHVALLHICCDENLISKRTLNRIMNCFGEVIQADLRLSDVISRCSTCQYIILLQDTDYENSCMVCQRLIAAFHHQHPHVSADIHFMVQRLNPTTRIPS